MSINWLHFFTGSLNLSRGDDAEPTLSATALTQRCMTLAAQLGDALEHETGELSFVSEISNTQAALTLGGRASEVIERNAGPKHRVVQLCSLSEEVFAWVGFRERWKRIGKERHFRFLDGGFTIHVGRQGEIFKPQIMRSEWVGRRGNDFHDHIGHPHWQIDILETARGGVPEVPVRFDAGSSPTPILEFKADQAAPQIDDVLLKVPIERMHLASAAPWWQPPKVRVANSPKTVSELDRWILGCVCYIRQELYRCKLV